MNFAELRAWELLCGGLAGILCLRFFVRIKSTPAFLTFFDKFCLSVLGFVLLAAVDWTTLVIFWVVSLVTFFGVRTIRALHSHHSARYLWILIPLQLAPLLYYKYSNFILNEVGGADFNTLRHLVIPAGISFYSFQLIAFAVDTLQRGEPVPRFLDFLNFAGFFPQIVAGPIERRSHLLPQIQNFQFRWNARWIDEGAAWIALGLFFKACLADNLAIYFDGDPVGNAYRIWLANLIFGLRIYFDFAGYSLIALGLARCLGINLTLNFTSPYCASNIGEFWQRWHITLSQWFRDYVYIPLGGNRVASWKRNILVVFVVSGIWHGAGWNFILWGGLHALYLIALRLYGKRASLGPLGWGLNLLAVFYAWMFFYETRPDFLILKAQALVTPAAYAPHHLAEFVALLKTADAFVMLCFLMMAGFVMLLEWWSIRRRHEPFYFLTRPGWVCLWIVLVVWLAPGRNNSFIYFSF